MNKHLPKVFVLNIEKLTNGEGPIKAHAYHVIPPNIVGNALKVKTYNCHFDNNRTNVLIKGGEEVSSPT